MSAQLKSNLVQIKAYKGRGTGILFPCKYIRTDKGYTPYLVFTCAHIFNNQISTLPNDGEDIKDIVDIEIHDDFGNLVDISDIKEVKYHIPENEKDSICDIALLLVQIKSNIRITIEAKIYQEELKNREVLYVEGYPRVMLNDEINQKIQLEGMYKELFPDCSAIGMYQIRDDYHWYNDYQDLKLMEGFSGSPVYLEKNDEVYLLGMNRSVANIDKGENPFKIVYYLKMKYILNCLRQSNCIIFRNNSDGWVDIEWVLDQEQEGDNITLFMLGGSGAGKSSFTKTFAYHGDRLNTTNDGQTTRSNVFYQFSLFQDKCKVLVQFFSKEDFLEKMSENLIIQKWLCFLEDIAEIDGAKSDYSGCEFLKNIYPFFRSLKYCHFKSKDKQHDKFRKRIKSEASKIETKISELLVQSPNTLGLGSKEYMERISDCYDVVIRFLWRYIPIQYWKYYFDINSWELRKKDRKLNNNSATDHYRYFEEIYELLREEYIWKDYLEKLGEKLFECIVEGKNNSNKLFYELFFGDKFITICHSLLHIEGFFDLSEVNFLDFYKSEKWNEILNSDYAKRSDFIKKVKQKNDIDETKDEKKEINLLKIYIDNTIRYLYVSLYDCFKEKIKEDKIEFSLTEGTPYEEELMKKCFQTTPKGSLTVFVRKIIVQDKISDQYAWIIRRLKINTLNILDSCGLDHIKNNVDDVSKIRNIVTEYRNSKEGYDRYTNIPTNSNKDHYAVVYLKKLDSGKPDELRTILPAVIRAIPEAPIYCVFTGVDIFYGRKDITSQDLCWDEMNLNRVPKAVKYLLLNTNEFSEDEKNHQITEKTKILFAGTGISDTRKRNLYLVLKNNLVPFCANQEVINNNFNLCESNQGFIEKLLISILVDEVGSMEIIQYDKALYGDLKEKNELEKKKNKDDIEETNEEIIEKIIGLIFEKATVKNWKSIHHMIRRADFNRLANEIELGYYSYVSNVRLQWFQLFSDAYKDVIATEPITQKFIQQFQEKYRAAIESTLIRMGDNYLFGNSIYFNQVEFNEKQTEFRKKLNCLFSNGHDVPIIKFSDLQNNDRKPTTEEIEEYLKSNTNFNDRYKRLESDDKKEFIRIFKQAFINQINYDNGVKSEGLIRINKEFEESFHNLENLFEIKYENKNLLYMVMKEYLKRKLK